MPPHTIFFVGPQRYHTGIKAKYLPSWCGDKTDDYWNLYHGKRTDGGAVTVYSPAPAEKTVLIGAYRTNLERSRFRDSDKNDAGFEAHPIVVALRRAARASVEFKFETIAKTYLTGYSNGDLSTHPAIVVISYQVSTMNLFEMYRLGIPLFFPSLKLLCEWYGAHHIMWERQYGQPDRLADLIGTDTDWPDPNAESEESFRFWVKLSDWYVWPHIQHFDSWESLVDKLNRMSRSDLEGISRKMMAHNRQQKAELVEDWTGVFARMKPTGRVHLT